jgi:Transcriptional Coactivator p15 (PC4)
MTSAAPGHSGKDAPRTPDSSRELARWESRGETVIVEAQRYGQVEVVAVRRWYPTENGLRPGRAGISFPIAELSDLAAAVDVARRTLDKNYTAPPPRAAPVWSARPGSTMMRLPVRSPPPPAIPVSTGRPLPAPLMQNGDRQLDPPSVPGVTRGAALPSTPPGAPIDPNGVTLAAIIAKGLVRAPLALRIKTRQGMMSGVAYADGTIVFGNRRFRSPREAYCTVTGQRQVVDAWQRITCRNPSTQRFAKLSRLRNLFLGLKEENELDDE